MKKVSTSALAKILKVDSKELINLLIENGYINIKNKSLFSSEKIKVLTEKGKNNGGELKTGTKFGDYIIWPENFNPYEKLGIKNIEYISVTELSKVFNIQAKRLNMIISEIGWMEHNIKGWKLTKLGEDIGGKQLIYDKTGKEYIKWPKEILENSILKKSLNLNGKVQEKNIKDKELEFREKFPANSRAKDGHNVRSRGEMLIDNALYEFKLVHAYERKLPVKEDVYTDFYLPSQRGGQAVYIEYWGYEDKEEYSKRKKIKQDLYKKYNLNLIEIENKHIDNLDDYLPRMLLEFGINVE